MKIKKIAGGMLLFVLSGAFAGCGNAEIQGEASAAETVGMEEYAAGEAADQASARTGEAAAEPEAAGESGDGIVDLTVLSSTMVYSEVFSMMVMPESYVGKTVKMEGTFSVSQGDGRNYYACVIADATACCAQGIEFVPDGEYRYPEDYPEPGSEIVVQGVFDTYEEEGNLYCQLTGAEILS